MRPLYFAVLEDTEIVYRHYVDISVAVATPKGLLVPVIRNVEGMNYAHIEKELARLGELVCARFSNMRRKKYFRRATTKSLSKTWKAAHLLLVMVVCSAQCLVGGVCLKNF